MSFFLAEALNTAQESVFDINSDDSWHMLRNVQALINAVILKAKGNNLLSGKFKAVATDCRRFFNTAKLNDSKGTPFELANILMCAGLLDLRKHTDISLLLLHRKAWLNYYQKGGVGTMGYNQARQLADSAGMTKECKSAIKYMCIYRLLVRKLIKVMPKSFPHYSEIKAIFKRFLELFSYELFFSLPRY